MPTCWAGSGDDYELIMSAPTLHEDCKLEKIDSPVPGYAVALTDDRRDIHKNGELENVMAFLNVPTPCRTARSQRKHLTMAPCPYVDDDGLSTSPSDECSADHQECISKDFNGLSAWYDSASEASDGFSTSASDGEVGPEDLVVIGHALPRSDSLSSLASNSGQPLLASQSKNVSEREHEGVGHTVDDLHQRSRDKLRSDGWWNAVNVSSVKGLEESTELTTLLDARVIKCQRNSKTPSPWEPGQSSELYTSMGMVDPSKFYAAVWLNLGAASFLFVFEFKEHDSWLETCLAQDFLSHRLKFLSNPVRMRGASPSKLPKDSEGVGSFFGKRNTSCSHAVTDNGVPHICIQLDVFSKWYVKIAFQQVALRPDNIMELLLVDGPSEAVLAGCRITVTAELLELLSA